MNGGRRRVCWNECKGWIIAVITMKGQQKQDRVGHKEAILLMKGAQGVGGLLSTAQCYVLGGMTWSTK